MNSSQDKFEEEIELIDILRVIWKWKYLILLGTLLFSVAAGIVSLTMTKIYRVDMILSPGILRIEENGKQIYIDSPQNIQALIEEGTFDTQILQNISNPEDNDLPKSLVFNVNIPKSSNTLKVSYQTSKIDRGLTILETLSKLLINIYSSLVSYYKSEAEMQIQLKNTEMLKLHNDIKEVGNKIATIKAEEEAEIKKIDYQIANLGAEIETRKRKIANFENGISETQSEIGRINKNTDLLIEERNKFVSTTKSENDILSSLVYSNTILQNIGYLNTLKSNINNNNNLIYQERLNIETAINSIKNLESQKDNLKKQTKYEIENLKTKIEDFENMKKDVLQLVKDLQLKNDNIQNIKILQPPISTPFPIKPRIKLNVVLATAVGFFIIVFLIFLLEYIAKHKSIKKD